MRKTAGAVLAFLSAAGVSAGSGSGSVQEQHEPRRPIPDKVIVGYATSCDCGSNHGKVKHAIREGVNVVIWAFLGIHDLCGGLKDTTQDTDTLHESGDSRNVSLHLDCIKQLIGDMDAEGYTDTLHLSSFGGWNGGHLDPVFRRKSPQDWFQTWKYVGGSVFHGIDWDLEGDDDLLSPSNFFSLDTLHAMGEVSRLAKQDGYAVTMAPPQSYLDIASSRFSRYVNLTDPTRTWHADFHYFGANVYAYLLAKYGDYIDLVSVQFYESYSRAAMQVFHDKLIPEGFLKLYVRDHNDRNQQFFVDFDQDPDCDIPSQQVPLPLSKMVWGFTNIQPKHNSLRYHQANSSTNDPERMIFFPVEVVQAAYQDLVDWEITPRGFMYWLINHDGTDGVDYAKDLNLVLHIRGNRDDESRATAAAE